MKATRGLILQVLFVAALSACGGGESADVPMDTEHATPAGDAPYCPQEGRDFVGPLPEQCPS